MGTLYRFLAVLLACLAFLALPNPTACQEFDTVITAHSRSAFTVADQILDPGERMAFLALHNERDAREKVKLAEAFLAAYPRSAFLAQVYEIAAKGLIDLEDYERALQYAKTSLALLAENPLLLVPVANVEARQGLTAMAKESARNALEYLERFEAPSSIPAREWPDLERHLKASSNFALGRATLMEALQIPPGQSRLSPLEQAQEFLVRARTLDSADPEIAYLLGVTNLALGQADSAAGNFAAATGREGGAIESKARAQLQKIYEMSPPNPKISFEAFVERLKAGSGPPFPPRRPESTAPAKPLSEYAGSEACRLCHVDIYRAWSQTGMARMFRPYRPENVIGDFESQNEFYEADAVTFEGDKLEVQEGKDRSLFARMVTRQGRHYFEIRQSDEDWHSYPVDYTIGSKWQQAYATRLPNGRIHVFPVQYTALHKKWVNFWKIIDTPGSPRADLRSWQRFDALTSYQLNCAVCHTSQLRNTKGGGFELDGLEFREGGIDCEMCHGPSARHVATIMKGELYVKPPLDPPVDFSKISAQEFNSICAQCHLQSAVRKPGAHGELNYYRENGVFFQRSKSRPYGEFSRKGFYKDGRFRQTTFIVESLVQSACFKKGQVTCGHCHDPHPADAASNPTSLKFRDQPDRMCFECHVQFKDKTAVRHHTRHPFESEGSRCVSCHMPRITEALLFRARTHRIDDIPNADMTLRFGQEESPNACLLCHSNRDAQWVNQKLVAWGTEMEVRK